VAAARRPAAARRSAGVALTRRARMNASATSRLGMKKKKSITWSNGPVKVCVWPAPSASSPYRGSLMAEYRVY
jgi:hypothetical protein